MGKLTRFGVSLDNELLEAFDKLCHERGYTNRSEAIRDLVRNALTQAQWGESDVCGGTLTLVYDHHRNDLSRRLMALQHDFHDTIIATMHVHLDHHTCLECLALKGTPQNVRALSDRLIACRGVKYGAFNPAPNAGDLC